MTRYRTGNHWGVTIVREGAQPTAAELDDCAFCCIRGAGGTGCPIHQRPEAELVAVVVNGDQALAERIVQLLNGPPYPPRCTFERDVRGCLCEPWPDCRRSANAAEVRR